jgi:arginase family enzyme
VIHSRRWLLASRRRVVLVTLVLLALLDLGRCWTSLTPRSGSGFWIHVDADVLDPAELPAVDSPTPGGLKLDELAELLTPLVRHPGALGLELTIYDPGLDPDRTSGARLAALLQRVLHDDGRR